MSEYICVDGIINNNTAPEIRLENLKDFNDLRTTLKDRSPVVCHESQTSIIRSFIWQGVVYKIEKPKKEEK